MGVMRPQGMSDNLLDPSSCHGAGGQTWANGCLCPPSKVSCCFSCRVRLQWGDEVPSMLATHLQQPETCTLVSRCLRRSPALWTSGGR